MYSKLDTLWAVCGQDVEAVFDRSGLQRHGFMDRPMERPKEIPPLRSQKSDPKSCAQCGVTKTPQWREGPLGPKTLCNACGVKRVRQLKGSGLSNRRRTNKVSLEAQTFHSETVDDPPYEEEQISHRTRHSSRPARKAATRSMSRAEEHDNRGEHGFLRGSLEGAAEPDPLGHSQKWPSEDESLEHSDSAEEVTWVPERKKILGPVPPSPGPVSGIVGTEDAAAVNLMSMSAAERPPSDTMVLLQEQHQPNLTSLPTTDISNKALRDTLNHFPDFEQSQQFIIQSMEFLPQDKQQEWFAIQAQMDHTLKTSAAAEAAVLAVAKVLAYKQAEAREARKRANEIVDVMRPFVLHIHEECQAQISKRFRSLPDY